MNQGIYSEIAAICKENTPWGNIGMQMTCEKLADLFSSRYPDFDKEQFLIECGLSHLTSARMVDPPTNP